MPQFSPTAPVTVHPNHAPLIDEHIARGLPAVFSLLQTAIRVAEKGPTAQTREEWRVTSNGLQQYLWSHLVNVYGMSEVQAARLVAAFVEAA